MQQGWLRKGETELTQKVATKKRLSFNFAMRVKANLGWKSWQHERFSSGILEPYKNGNVVSPWWWRASIPGRIEHPKVYLYLGFPSLPSTKRFSGVFGRPDPTQKRPNLSRYDWKTRDLMGFKFYYYYYYYFIMYIYNIWCTYIHIIDIIRYIYIYLVHVKVASNVGQFKKQTTVPTKDPLCWKNPSLVDLSLVQESRLKRARQELEPSANKSPVCLPPQNEANEYGFLETTTWNSNMKSLTSFNRKEQHLENCVHVSFIAMLEDFVFFGWNSYRWWFLTHQVLPIFHREYIFQPAISVYQ